MRKKRSGDDIPLTLLPPFLGTSLQLSARLVKFDLHFFVECRQIKPTRIKYDNPEFLRPFLGEDKIANKQILKF